MCIAFASIIPTGDIRLNKSLWEHWKVWMLPSSFFLCDSSLPMAMSAHRCADQKLSHPQVMRTREFAMDCHSETAVSLSTISAGRPIAMAKRNGN